MWPKATPGWVTARSGVPAAIRVMAVILLGPGTWSAAGALAGRVPGPQPPGHPLRLAGTGVTASQALLRFLVWQHVLRRLQRWPALGLLQRPAGATTTA